MLTCPCCGYRTLDGPDYGCYDICELCGWEDDHVQLAHPMMGGGANKVCLLEAQQNFENLATADPDFPARRKPTSADRRDPAWRPFDTVRDGQATPVPASGLEYFDAAADESASPYWLKR